MVYGFAAATEAASLLADGLRQQYPCDSRRRPQELMTHYPTPRTAKMKDASQSTSAARGQPERPGRTLLSTALAVAIVPTLLLTGCGTVLWETGQDMQVYFENSTDQTLELRLRDDLDERHSQWQINSNQTTTLSLVFQGECLDSLLITDENGIIVKDPGRICWHDTIAIP